jgi:hypothetical protein
MSQVTNDVMCSHWDRLQPTNTGDCSLFHFLGEHYHLSIRPNNDLVATIGTLHERHTVVAAAVHLVRGRPTLASGRINLF